MVFEDSFVSCAQDAASKVFVNYKIKLFSFGLWKGRGLRAFRHFFGEEMIQLC